MQTPHGDEPLSRSRGAGAGTPLPLLILQFMGALVVMALLAAGPSVEEAFGTLRGYLQGAPSAGAVPATPAGPERAAPEAGVRPATLAVTPQAQPRPPVVPASPSPAPAVTRPPASGASAGGPAPPRPAPRKTASPAVPAVPPATPASRLDAQKQYVKLMREGHELYQAGWYGPALGRFKQAAVAAPASATAHLWIGRAAMKVGRFTEARQALERVVELAPATEAAFEARLLLAWFR